MGAFRFLYFSPRGRCGEFVIYAIPPEKLDEAQRWMHRKAHEAPDSTCWSRREGVIEWVSREEGERRLTLQPYAHGPASWNGFTPWRLPVA